MTPVPPGLDLAFSCDEALSAEQLEAAGPLADPATAEGPWRDLLAAWLEQMQPELPQALRAPAYSLGLSLVGDREMAELNESWRNQQGPTDVLAFAAQDEGLEGAPAMPKPPELASDQESPEQGEPLELGDIVISLDTAVRQAEAAGVSLARELSWLASHGLLHLLGWDHPDDARLEAMLRRQDQLLECCAGSDGSDPPGRRR
ncbi:rRNA maturation RNase YbeY [Synechococcus sp. BA-124 BA4]|nr:MULTISPECIES: rRNA maturation RNase YbeY [unclassified Synechococcus]MEA5398961.1 rRNA maturation RNase YbeY [Synechococcus sp. BA-124 BA4]QPN55577.1 rRNA maturation RNase YbeY [Synechococcus sp. CBW1107]CAK6690600.1 Endoribonuclease YbeY [Synechococcus sp. CBW1107]